MTYDNVVALISSVGFPIVAYGAMFYYMIKQHADHKEEMNKLSDAVCNNTIALQKLADAMDKENN